MARWILQGINMTGSPPDPRSSAEDLGTRQLAGAWEGGAIAPLTFRGLAGLLLDMPDAGKRAVGALLTQAAGYPSEHALSQILLRASLVDLQEADLDLLPNQLVVGIDVEAPQRAIVAAIEKLVAQKKKELGVRERRRRHELLGPYLKVWDLREGWTGASYDTDRELFFPDIAKRLRMNRRTAVNHYQAAFRLISGHEYSIENWFKLFVALKLADQFAGVRALKRRRISREQTGPQGPVCASEQVEATSESVTAPEQWLDIEDYDVRELLGDIQPLIRAGWSDEKILEELEWPAEHAKLLRALRSRLA